MNNPNMFQFTAEDLALNQEGRLSASQQAALQAGFKKKDAMAHVAMIAFSILIILGALSQILILREGPPTFVGALSVVAFYYAILKPATHRHRREVLTGEKVVESVQGKIELIGSPHANSPILKVDGKTFYPGREICSQLENDQNYIVYFFNALAHRLNLPLQILSWQKTTN